MALLINNIYCRKKILVSALGNSKAVTHIARRLVGVFRTNLYNVLSLVKRPEHKVKRDRQKRLSV